MRATLEEFEEQLGSLADLEQDVVVAMFAAEKGTNSGS